MRISKTFPFLCTLARVASASAEASPNSPPPRRGLRHLQSSPADGRPILDGLYRSVTLATGPGGCSGTQEAVLDVYRSPGGAAAPTVLQLPGGAYMNLVGDVVESAGAQYLEAGYTLAVLYYRLPRSATDRSWLLCSDPWEAVEDVSAAMRILNENSAEYYVDQNQIVISGFSAGGHLGSLYSSICEERDSCPRAQVLHFPFLEQGAKIFCSEVGSAFNNLEEYGDCFPTSLVDGATPPTVLYHASGDPIVPRAQMLDFVASLDEHGSSFEYYAVEGGGHYLVPFSQVASASDGVLDAGGSYASLVERAIGLPPAACVRCDDIPTKWMADNGKTCGGAEYLINRKCAGDSSWTASGYCRSSCFWAGRGYPRETCCPPKGSPDCTVCSDQPTPWMASNGKTCEASTGTIQTKCKDDSWWVANNYCQKTCFDEGRGYNGIDCCA